MKLNSILSNKNKRGFAGMGLIWGMFVALIVFIMLSAFLPTIISMFGTTKGSNSANCVGYVDPHGVYSYNASLNSDTLTCSIVNFGPGLFVLAIIISVISGIIAGKFANEFNQEQQQPQQYPQYSQY